MAAVNQATGGGKGRREDGVGESVITGTKEAEKNRNKKRESSQYVTFSLKREELEEYRRDSSRGKKTKKGGF